MKKTIISIVLALGLMAISGCSGSSSSSSSSSSGSTQTLATGQSATITTGCSVVAADNNTFYSIAGGTITVTAGSVTLTC